MRHPGNESFVCLKIGNWIFCTAMARPTNSMHLYDPIIHINTFPFVQRDAAKECRRKKKEYVKCLENRVAVLENQNKALIEELKSLKELYCQKDLV